MSRLQSKGSESNLGKKIESKKGYSELEIRVSHSLTPITYHLYAPQNPKDIEVQE